MAKYVNTSVGITRDDRMLLDTICDFLYDKRYSSDADHYPNVTPIEVMRFRTIVEVIVRAKFGEGCGRGPVLSVIVVDNSKEMMPDFEPLPHANGDKFDTPENRQEHFKAALHNAKLARLILENAMSRCFLGGDMCDEPDPTSFDDSPHVSWEDRARALKAVNTALYRERDELKRQTADMQEQLEKNVDMAMMLALMGGEYCPSHSDENAMPFEQFKATLEGQCPVCNIKELRELRERLAEVSKHNELLEWSNNEMRTRLLWLSNELFNASEENKTIRLPDATEHPMLCEQLRDKMATLCSSSLNKIHQMIDREVIEDVNSAMARAQEYQCQLTKIHGILSAMFTVERAGLGGTSDSPVGAYLTEARKKRIAVIKEALTVFTQPCP
jgi:hypothetical protein